MAEPDYPDRADWPRYWRAIRRTGVRLALGATAAVGLAAFGPGMTDHPWRLAIVIVIAFIVAVVVDWLCDRLLSWWDGRLEGS